MISRDQTFHRLTAAVRFDACAFAVVLTLFGAAFYLNWDFWDDQAAQAYMTWGMFHGMRPYVDLVDPNWPGILLPHALAYVIAGTSAWGLRALDLVFAFAMLMATSWVLAAWGTPLAMRVLAGCAYLTNYFATGWMWTAQRESFCWPLFVIGAVPLLLVLGPRDQGSTAPPMAFRNRAWFWFGVAGGLGLWIKPSPLLAVIVLAALAVILCDRAERAAVVRGIAFHLAGIATVSLLFIIALAAMGELSGFVKWGIRYDLGPYSQVKFPWPVRLHIVYEFLTDVRLRPIALALGIVGSAVAFCWPASSRRWAHPARPIIVSFALVITGALSVLIQGKPGSLYHFIPLDWALAAFAAVVWSIVPWTNRTRDSAMVMALLVVALTIYKEPRNAGITAGSVAGAKLNSMLGPRDELVEWGYSPSLLLRAQRRTPFMTFIATAFLTTTPADSWATREVLDRLNTALRDPAVRYLLVEQLPNYRIRADSPRMPIDYLQMDDAVRETLRTQYQLEQNDPFSGFTTFRHIDDRTTHPPISK
jgi:hypothetical protein